MAGSLSTEVELKVSAHKLWDTIKYPDIVAKIMPDLVTSWEYLEGDGGIGSIRLMKFGPAVAHFVTFSKEKIEVVDEAAMKLGYSVIESELLNYYKLYRVGVTLVQGEAQDSCTVKWELGYEALSPETPPPEIAKEGAITTFKALEAYILGNSSV